MRSFGTVILFAAFALAGNGCGGKDKLTKVHGVLTLDGNPVENAMVTFVPAQAGAAKYASGTTRSGGSFELTTTSANDGAFPGDYLVVVQYEEGSEVPPARNVKEAFEGAQKVRQQKIKKLPKYLIPNIYSDATKTPLRQKVPPDGPVKLELQSKTK